MKKLLKKLLAPVIREVVNEQIKEINAKSSLSSQEFERVVRNEFQKVLSAQE